MQPLLQVESALQTTSVKNRVSTASLQGAPGRPPNLLTTIRKRSIIRPNGHPTSTDANLPPGIDPDGGFPALDVSSLRSGAGTGPGRHHERRGDGANHQGFYRPGI